MYGALLLLSETILSAYPLLIKLVDTSIFFQTGLRMFIYAILAAIAAGVMGVPLMADALFSPQTIAVGTMNLLHVLTSYTAFNTLAAGNAMALFYTYPVWNIIGAAIAFKEKLELSSLPWIGTALLGAILLAQPTSTNWTVVGVISALVAALTETGIYLWFRSSPDDKKNTEQPWTKMIQMYGSSGVLWAVAAIVMTAMGIIGARTWNVSGQGLAGIVAFNAFVGFTGYALRFYIIPKVSTVVFSALSFFGIITAYILGWLFVGETPTLTQGLGAAAIILANTVLLRKEVV